MFKILHFTPKTYSKVNKIPQKTIFIVTKNGKSKIKDEFIGYYVKRPNPLELVTELIEKLLSIFNKS